MSWFTRKEPVMAEKELEIDYDKLGAAVAKAMTPAFASALKPVADAQKVMADTMAADATARAEASKKAPEVQAAPAAGKPLTAEDVAKLVADQLKASQTSQQQADARKSYLGDKLKDLPAVYQNQLGNDPSKWAAEEQTIREAYKADFKAAGGVVPPVSGNAGAAGATLPAATVDYSKMTPTQLITAGLAASTPQGPRAAGVSTASPAAAAK